MWPSHLLYTSAKATSRKTASVPRLTRSASVTKSVSSAMIAAGARKLHEGAAAGKPPLPIVTAP